jgi:recombination protein RecT
MTTPAPSSEVAIRNPKDLQAYLSKSLPAIEMALPKHLNANRMMRLAMTCFSTTPALQGCTPRSILASVVVASQLGLEPGIAGQGYLIPYKGTCTFVPGWQGLVSLLNNTGRATAWTGAVFEGDHWDFELGSRPRCQHIPGDNYGDPDKLTWVYACGKVNGSEQPVIEAWPMGRVWKHRDKFNKVGTRHYSYQNEEMYARKVVLLQVLKYMPRSIELNNAITASDAAEMGRASRVEDSVVVIDSEALDIPGSPPKFDAPKPIADTTSPGPKSEGPTEPGPTTPMNPVRQKLVNAGVTFSRFTQWCVSTGRAADAHSWFTAAEADGLAGERQYDKAPKAIWTALELDDMGVSKCITLNGGGA